MHCAICIVNNRLGRNNFEKTKLRFLFSTEIEVSAHNALNMLLQNGMRFNFNTELTVFLL